jgi:hypothetical protein
VRSIYHVDRYPHASAEIGDLNASGVCCRQSDKHSINVPIYFFPPKSLEVLLLKLPPHPPDATLFNCRRESEMNVFGLGENDDRLSTDLERLRAS